MKKIVAAAVLMAALAACANMGGARTPVARFEGGMLVDPAGMTLYTYDKDAGSHGRSACSGACAMIWPPLKAAETDLSYGVWSVIVREDGSRQWAYKGKPLYLWVKDRKPGDRTGDGVNKVWRVATQ